MGHVGTIRTIAQPNTFPLVQDEIRDFVCQHAAKALPQLRVLGCYPANGKFFYLHLDDPFSQASLLLPIANQWVEECMLGCGSSACRLGPAFDQAAKILDFSGPVTPGVN